MPQNIIQGWHEQYDRMVRGKDKLVGLATGTLHLVPRQHRDTVIHFFQDAHHLKDWISNDPNAPTSNVETFVDSKFDFKSAVTSATAPSISNSTGLTRRTSTQP